MLMHGIQQKGLEAMDDMGLCVTGLDSVGISQKMERYVIDYFPAFKLDTGQSMFMEGHVFYLEEIDSVVPDKYHHLFTDESKFICMSGFIAVSHAQDQSDERTIMLIMDDRSERVYLLLYLQEVDDTGEERIFMIKDFLE